MMRLLVRASGLSLLLAALAVPASAQIVQSVGLGAGVFTPRGFASRVDGDVWVANLTQPEVLPGVTGSLSFEIGDFRAVPVFGEWNIAFGNHIEASVGVSYYGKTVHSRYRDLVNSARENAEIEQDLQLRAIPVTGVVRFLPFGAAGGFQPYAGVGIAVVTFRYTEIGEFVDTTDFSIFHDKYSASGAAVGPVLLGGLRMPIGGDVYAFTIEGRYQWASGDTGGTAEGFLGPKLDLSGGFLNFGVLIRF